jgi:ribonuclease P/MRP protein subunit RPP1
MPYYDLHVYTSQSIGESTIEEMIAMAKRLGLDGLGIVRFADQPRPDFSAYGGIDLIDVVMIKPRDVEEFHKLIERVRDSSEVVSVAGGDYEINRLACETPAVDILCHPEYGRRDSGLDHVCVRAAAENHVAIELNFRHVLESYKQSRSGLLAALSRNVLLCKKYNAPIITTSASLSKWNLRSGRELVAFATLLGLDLTTAVDSVSQTPIEIVKTNREKLSQKAWKDVRIVGESNGI